MAEATAARTRNVSIYIDAQGTSKDACLPSTSKQCMSEVPLIKSSISASEHNKS